MIFSGNDALDAILNTKQAAAHQYGINFDAVIADSLQFMSADDICILFGNLLDNYSVICLIMPFLLPETPK